MSTATVVTIEEDGYLLSVKGRYYRGAPQTYTQPADPSEFEIETIHIQPNGYKSLIWTDIKNWEDKAFQAIADRCVDEVENSL